MEAERRIRSMALVHEILSRDVGDQVDFQEVVGAVVQLAQESVPPGLMLDISVAGAPGELDAAKATPLALTIAELIQNSIEHAFGGREEGRESRSGSITISLSRGEECLYIEVADTGVGFPEGFDPENSSSLGLAIVRSLVTTQLGGSIRFESQGGARVLIEVPVEPGLE